MRETFTGVGTALITPFTRTATLDEAGIRRLARRQVEAGVHFLVPCGTTGETPTLTADERRRVVEIVAEEAEGRSLVLAGVPLSMRSALVYLAASDLRGPLLAQTRGVVDVQRRRDALTIDALALTPALRRDLLERKDPWTSPSC